MGWNPFSWTKKDVIEKGLVPSATGGGRPVMSQEDGVKQTAAQYADPADPEAGPGNPSLAPGMTPTDRYEGTSWSGTAVNKPYNTLSANQSYDERAYMYGRDPNAANDAVNKANQVGDLGIGYGNQGVMAGNGAAQMGGYLLGQRTADAGMYQGRSAPQGDFGAQNATLGQLGGLEATQGPSAAQAQLQQGNNQAMAGQIALARSGRGFGGNAAAAGLAQSNLAGLQASNANASAALAAQENAAWRGRQAANMGAVAGMQGQQSQANLGAKLTGQAQNDAAALQSLGLGQQALTQGQAMQQQGYQTGLAGISASLNGQTLGSNIRGMEMGGGQALDDRNLRGWAAKNGYELQQQQMQDQRTAGYINAAATTGGALLALSDIRAKTNVVPSDEAGRAFARGGVVEDEAFDAAHPGVATSYLTDQGKRNYAANDALRLKHEAAGREFAEYGDDGLGHGRTAAYRSKAFGKGLGFDGTLYRPGGMTPMQAAAMGGPVTSEQSAALGKTVADEPGSGFAPEARPDASRPFDMDTLDAAAQDAVRRAPGSFYDYKDPNKPGADAGRHYGPMAQDLAKTPAGASAVVKQPDGSLGVDTGRLSLVNTGALSAQQQQLDEIQRQLEAFRTSPSAVQPDQVYRTMEYQR